QQHQAARTPRAGRDRPWPGRSARGAACRQRFRPTAALRCLALKAPSARRRTSRLCSRDFSRPASSLFASPRTPLRSFASAAPTPRRPPRRWPAPPVSAHPATITSGAKCQLPRQTQTLAPFHPDVLLVIVLVLVLVLV